MNIFDQHSIMQINSNITPEVVSRDINKNQLVDVLQKASSSLTVKEIRAALRKYCQRQPEHLITRALRGMIKEGLVAYRGGRWSLAQIDSTAIRKKRIPLQFETKPPDLSSLGSSILRNTLSGHDAFPLAQENKIETITHPDNTDVQDRRLGPWATFRSLLAYYKECIRNEEGADASAFINEYTKRFLYFHGIGSWYPKSGRAWKYSIPIGAHLAGFIKELSNAGEGNIVVLGYPLQAVYIKKENEPDVAIIRPVFQYILETSFNHGLLVFSTEEARPELCLDWLKYAFPNHDQQRSFLSACGLINRPKPIDEAPGLEVGDGNPSLDNLVGALSAFFPQKIKEPLQINNISSNQLYTPFETGIYNKAVIMLGSRTKYTKTLLNELSYIEQLDDKILDATALKFVFRDNKDGQGVEFKELEHEAIVADTVPLNAEQRMAVASLMKRDISVITGPPGTGKSQVVCSAIANARLNGETVLFASRNHKAIDAVVDRLKDSKDRSLIIRTNSKDDPSLRYTFTTAIRDLLSNNVDLRSKESLNRAIEELQSLLKKRGEKAKLANSVQLLRDQLGELEERMAYLTKSIPQEAIPDLNDHPERFPWKAVDQIKDLTLLITKHEERTLFLRPIQIVRILSNTPKWVYVWLKLKKFSGLAGLPLTPPFRRINQYADFLQILCQTGEYSNLRKKTIPLIVELKEFPPLEELTNSIKEMSDRISSVTPDALSLHLDSKGGLLPGDTLRESLASLKVALQVKTSGFSGAIESAERESVLKEKIPFLLSRFPSWAVTNLSVGSRIPLSPGIFDLAIIDEASQSDIPSGIPILFRSKKAAVVGDPSQLTHSTKLSVAKDSLLRKRVGLIKLDDLKFSYSDTSIYNLFAHSKDVSPIFLSDTYRSVDAIAGYSNTLFYNGRLRVATDVSNLIIPDGGSAGIHWTEIRSEVKSSGGSGCYSTEEINSVFTLLRSILLENNYRGTIGVITPFRQQANRLNDIIFESDIPYDLLASSQVHVDTSHGFQGDERDVIIFSLCAGPDMPTGSRAFLRETSNLFNVAVSRARAVLHVVGNRTWAQRCGIQHIQNLATPVKKQEYTPQKNQWHPHESPWEKILYDALTMKGLKPVPQFPVAGRRLDLALVCKNNHPLKIDIEVDGDRYHRSPDGLRKKEDVWRDIQLQGRGWKVIRFWVYQLREDLEGCVEKIVNIWSEHD